MRGAYMVAFTFVALVGAPAEAPADPAVPRSDARRFEADPEARRRFAELRARRTRPPLRPAPVLPARPEEAHVEGVLLGHLDGVARVGVPVEPAMAEVLERQGALRVTRPEELRDHVLFEGRYVREYPCAPDVTEARLSGLVGRAVKLTLARSHAGRHVVIGAAAGP